MKALFFILLIYPGFNAVSFSQTREIDSLQTLLHKSSADTNRAIILNRLAFRYYDIIPDTALMYANQALTLSENLNYHHGIANSYNSLGFICNSHADLPAALSYYKQSLEILQNIGDLSNVHKTMNNIGIVYKNMGDYPKAIAFLQKSLDIKTKLNATDQIGGTYNNLGIIYQDLGDMPQALTYYLKALEAKKASGNLTGLNSTFFNLGEIKSTLGQYAEARTYYNLALEANLKSNNKRSLALVYQSLGRLLQKTDTIDQALFYLKNSLQISLEIDFPSATGSTLNEIGNIYLINNKLDSAGWYFSQGLAIEQSIDHYKGMAQSYLNIARLANIQEQFENSLKNAKNSLEIAKNIGLKKEIAAASKLIYLTYQKLGNDSKAFEYLLLHKNYSDSLLDEIKLKEIANIGAKNEIIEITRENELLQKENVFKLTQLGEQEARLHTQRIVMAFSIFALLIALIGTYVIYTLYVSKKQAHILLEKKNEEIIEQKNKIEIQARELREVNAEIKVINESLEKTITTRTEKIQLQNIQLRKYAFANSHNVRAPLARLMGLVHLSKIAEIPQSELEYIYGLIGDSARELDEIIREISKNLNAN
jgi:tetratricopeptide (TPR) repeat protein